MKCVCERCYCTSRNIMGNICRLQIWQKPQISVSGSVFDVSEKYFTARWDVLRRNTENKNQSNRKQAERNMEGDYEEKSVNKIFYDNDRRKTGMKSAFRLCFIYNSYKIACQERAGNPPVFLTFFIIPVSVPHT